MRVSPVKLSRTSSRGEIIAWVDESGSNASKDPGTYLLSAALCFQEIEELCRSQIRDLLLRGQKKVHWVDESRSRRRKIISQVASLPIENVIVVRSTSKSQEKPERQRRKCLETMFTELESFGVKKVILESRSPAQDQNDMKMLNYLRTRRSVSQIRIDHMTGPSEPMLWVPDACCGAVVEQRLGNAEYFAEIASKTTVYSLAG